ncbi:hypothetical protein [Klebsiella pneumoniae]|uniref:hypothetical protein n=1 Tax=Klebsiella pneumoniae TaxID=573 RepID=UPI000E2AF34C|nr:hypothetical protein [Klebsiella pneumoniae]VVJ58674.1 Uncharacterised protein [Klebsiella pneumoniae]
MNQLTKTKPILLTYAQREALEIIQSEERARSPYGAAPSIPELVRSLLDIALKDVYAGIEKQKEIKAQQEDLEKLLATAPVAEEATKDFLATRNSLLQQEHGSAPGSLNYMGATMLTETKPEEA